MLNRCHVILSLSSSSPCHCPFIRILSISSCFSLPLTVIWRLFITEIKSPHFSTRSCMKSVLWVSIHVSILCSVREDDDTVTRTFLFSSCPSNSSLYCERSFFSFSLFFFLASVQWVFLSGLIDGQSHILEHTSQSVQQRLILQ